MDIEMDETSGVVAVALALCALVAFIFMLAYMRSHREAETRESIATMAITNGLVQTIPPGMATPIWVRPETK